MNSTFTWLDHSERDRRRMLDVIDHFREGETRDELGLGAIRDSFADQMFPGTSTIQTRLRYMLFVPWMYRPFEETCVPSREVASRGRVFELSLVKVLLKQDDPYGVFGRTWSEERIAWARDLQWERCSWEKLCQSFELR